MRFISKNINVIGLGYIGLPTATLLAEHGHAVTGANARAGAALRVPPLGRPPGGGAKGRADCRRTSHRESPRP